VWRSAACARFTPGIEAFMAPVPRSRLPQPAGRRPPHPGGPAAAWQAYALLRRRFIGTSLVPVRNLAVAKGLPYRSLFPHTSTLAVSLEIPVLGPAGERSSIASGFHLPISSTHCAPFEFSAATT
jgi:hypothetical protein